MCSFYFLLFFFKLSISVPINVPPAAVTKNKGKPIAPPKAAIPAPPEEPATIKPLVKPIIPIFCDQDAFFQ